MPSKQLSRATVDDERESGPAVTSTPDSTQVGGPPLIGCSGDRWHRLYSRPEAHGTLPHLPVSQLENALHGVPVELQQVRNSPVAEGRILFDHLFDGLEESVLQHGLFTGRTVVHGAPRYFEPPTQLA